MLNQLLTADELAARWHVSPGHLANLRSLRQGCRFLKVGGRILYRLEDVLAQEDASIVETTERAA